MLLIAINLRPAITSVGPLIEDIRAATGISAALAGLLTTLPLLAFGAISPLAPLIARRIGIESALAGAVAVLALGLVVRATGPIGVVFVATAGIGSAVAVGNVLVPSLIKRDFAHRTGVMMGLYTTALSGSAGLAASLSVPLADGAELGWRGALAAWALPAALAAALWSGALRRRPAPAALATARPSARLRGSPVAWQVTLFLGLQSLVFYALMTWLPAILQDDGMSAATAGWLVGLMQLVSLAGTMGVPVLAARRRSQRRLVLGSALLCLGGLAGAAAAGARAAPVWVVPLGVGEGALFSLALSFCVLRAADASAASALSGMAQSIGYLVAAAGPLLLGALHDVTGAWDAPLAALVVVTLAMLAAGLAAARDLQVGGPTG